MVPMTAAPIHLAGERLMLDPAGALYWPATSLLAVSDLHLEKGSSYARHGQLLPPWDTHTTLDRLTLLLRRYRPRLVVALGDSFHDTDGSNRLPTSELSRLRVMTEAHRFIWVQGNHDPSPQRGVGGEWVERVHHREPDLSPPGKVRRTGRDLRPPPPQSGNTRTRR